MVAGLISLEPRTAFQRTSHPIHNDFKLTNLPPTRQPFAFLIQERGEIEQISNGIFIWDVIYPASGTHFNPKSEIYTVPIVQSIIIL